MQPKLTDKEYFELQKLMGIVRDKNRLPGERRIAMAMYDQIYTKAKKRTAVDRQSMLQLAK